MSAITPTDRWRQYRTSNSRDLATGCSASLTLRRCRTCTLNFGRRGCMGTPMATFLPLPTACPCWQRFPLRVLGCAAAGFMSASCWGGQTEPWSKSPEQPVDFVAATGPVQSAQVPPPTIQRRSLAEEQPVSEVQPGRLPSENGYVVVRVPREAGSIELFLHDSDGTPWRRLERLRDQLRSEGRQPSMLMNAGMYHADLEPVGLLVVGGQELSPLNLSAGDGNFYLQPNGVFGIANGVPAIWESQEFARQRPTVTQATQSGPLLLHDGQLHPALREDSTSRRTRNAVCVNEQLTGFIYTPVPVTFHELATYMRDELNCIDGLYLDGTVSSVLLPNGEQWLADVDLGPMVAVFAR
jgi:uncharacterized protein YigE (DUF2233 family)